MAASPVRAIPEGYHQVTPSIVVDDADKALAFYHDALGAQELYRLPVGDKVGHAFDRAVKAGATVVQDLQDQFWGDRTGAVADPFGHKWLLATHAEDVPPEEMQRRSDAWTAQQQG